MSTLDELATFLHAEGVGILGQTLFKGSLPLDHPATDATPPIVALIEVPGLPVVRSHDMPPARYEQPVIQVATRGTIYGYPAARAKAQEAFMALDGVANVLLGTTFYLWIEALQSPFFLRYDETNRPIIIFNIRCARDMVA